MTIWNGPQVSYGSAGKWYVQVEVTDSGATTASTVTVSYTYRVIFTQSISDTNNTVEWSDPWGSGSISSSFVSSSGATFIPIGANPNRSAAGISYGVNNTLHFRFYVTGLAGGATGPSSVEFDYVLPRRLPDVPTQPGITFDSYTATSVRAVISAADGRGAEIVEYQTICGRDYSNLTNLLNSQVQNWTGGTGHIGGLSPVTTYGVVSRARNSAGWGAWTPIATFTTLSTVPSAPNAPAVASLGVDSAALTWAWPSNGGAVITSARLQVSTSPAFANPTEVTSTITSATVTGLLPGTLYYARVRADNINGPGAWSATTTFTTLSGLYVRYQGAWRLAKVYVRYQGAWRTAQLMKRVSGTWRN